MVKIGSLCSGYGGLDLAAEVVFNAETVWMCDVDKYADIAIKHNWNLPNLGDLKLVNWELVEKIDILTAGYPCQPFSNAGQRKGLNDERHIWPHIKEIIGYLQPKWVVLENVRGHLSLGFKEVLEDLTEIGYDAKWTIVRASDVGAPHQRARLFIIAYPSSKGLQRTWNKTNDLANEIAQHTNTDGVGQSLGINGQESDRNKGKSQFKFTKLDKIGSNTNDKQLSSNGSMQKLGRRFDSRFEMSMRAIPNPLDDGKLNTKFVEYMMGLPDGWVTNLPVSRSQQFKLLGNGVVPQQAEFAITKLLNLG
jgi:DNA (cytosine-5)-methyltransferase 1